MTKSIQLRTLWHKANPDPNAVIYQVIALDVFNDMGLGSIRKAQGGVSLEQQLIDLFEGGAWGDANYVANDITRNYLLARHAINEKLKHHGFDVAVY